MQAKAVASTVQDITNKETAHQTDNDSDGDGLGLLGESDTADEDNGLETLAQDGDEGKDEQGVPARAVAKSTLVLGVHGLGELGLPLLLDLGGAEHGQTHDGDHDDSEQTEAADPNALGAGPQVVGVLVPRKR